MLGKRIEPKHFLGTLRVSARVFAETVDFSCRGLIFGNRLVVRHHTRKHVAGRVATLSGVWILKTCVLIFVGMMTVALAAQARELAGGALSAEGSHSRLVKERRVKGLEERVEALLGRAVNDIRQTAVFNCR